jgi:hypothetical protein
VEKLTDATNKKNLVAFFYQLIRDHMPLGEVEKLVRENEIPPEDAVVFTNGYLARYAQECVARLMAEEGKVKDD